MTAHVLRKTLQAAVIGLLLSFLFGCKNYVGVEWVQDYDAVGKHYVAGRKPCAEGFYDTIRAHPEWEGRFNRGNADAWEEHFKRVSMGGTDPDWIDNVDFAYFAGHGCRP